MNFSGKDLEELPIVIADIKVHNSLIAMAKQAKVVLNCVGPYRFHGDQVVRACIEGGASHLDISGEPEVCEKYRKLGQIIEYFKLIKFCKQCSNKLRFSIWLQKKKN